MILEGLVTSVSPSGDVNIAPMGPDVESLPNRFLLRPFRTSHTYRNLKAQGEGVLHVCDDVLLLARAVLGPIQPLPPLFPALRVRGFVLREACRYFEFRVSSLEESEERARIEAEVVHSRRLRDFFGFNRAKHAVVEAAILASRFDFLPLEEIETEYRKLKVLVEKTGGPQEREAFVLLQDYLAARQEKRAGEGHHPGGA
jgi:hypothetical protein